MTTEKMTNVKAIAYVLENCVDLPAEVVEKLSKMQASYEKKSGGVRKPTAHQNENEVLKGEILAQMEPNTLYSVADMAKTFTFSCGEISANRVSALVTQLKNAGQVVRTEEKRKAFFSLPVEE